MADIINYANFEEIQNMISSVNQRVSGMTASEASEALGAKPLSNGIQAVPNYSAPVNPSSNIIEFPSTNATEAMSQFIEQGGAVNEAGSALSNTGSVQSSANLALVEGATTGSVGVAGLLSMPVPAVVAGLAPLAGVAIGYGLYESNPEFFDNIASNISDFLVNGSEAVSAVLDEAGRTYLPYSLVNRIKSLFSNVDEPTIDKPVDSPEVSNVYQYPIPISTNGVTFKRSKYGHPDGAPLTEYEGENCVVLFRDMNNTNPFYTGPHYYNVLRWSTSPLEEYTGSYTYNNKTVYYTYTGHLNNNFILSPKPILTNSNPGTSFPTIGAFAWTLAYGTANYVEGVNTWTGDTYPENPDTINVLHGYDDRGFPLYHPYYPFSLPDPTEPWITTDPSINPDPTINPQPAPAIEPYIKPETRPEQYPEPVRPAKEIATPIASLPPLPSTQVVPDPTTPPNNTGGDVNSNPAEPKKKDSNGVTPTPAVPSIIPPIPAVASDSSLYHVYNPTDEQIRDFGKWLWTTFSGDLIETISKLYSNPMEAVIGLHELYATPNTNGTGAIKAGFLTSNVDGVKLVTDRYSSINCGSIVIPEYFQNYLDYSPYTECLIYLPFIGIIALNSDDIVGSAVNVTYNIDSYTGCCIAIITVAKKGYSATIYQYEGNCSVEIPITSGYQATLVGGLITMAGLALPAAVPAALGGGTIAVNLGRAGMAKNDVQHSGCFGSSYGAMGIKKPYIIVRRPNQKEIYNYSESYGYPAYKSVVIGNCTGYLRVKEVRVTSSRATNIEKEMIERALKEGVYVK